MKLNGSQIMVITALCLAIVAVCVGIVVEVFPASPVTPTISAPTENDAPIVSLNPNLKAEFNVGSAKGDQVVYGVEYAGFTYVFYNSEELGGSLVMLDEALNLTSTVTLRGEISYATLCEGGFLVALKEGNQSRCVWLDFNGNLTNSGESYEGQAVQAVTAFEEGEAVIFYTENQMENNLIFRFYENGNLVFERYASSFYKMQVADFYRVDKQFFIFFRYYSQYSSGGGYCVITRGTISTKCVYVELSYDYQLLDVCPTGKSFCLLTSGEKGVKLLILDENLNRNKAVELSSSPYDNGNVLFDGSKYYCFIGKNEGGVAFDLGASFLDKIQLSAYAGISKIAYEINVGGNLVLLCESTSGYPVVTSVNGLFSKRISGSDCRGKLLISSKLGLILVGDGALSNTTLSSKGGNDVYLALLN